MVVGLNKDLERALKDRERYRKKLKEHLAQVPPLPNVAQRIEAPDREHSSSPALSEAQEAVLSSRSNNISTPDSMPDALRLLNRTVSVEQHTLASQHSQDAGSPSASAESPPIQPGHSASAEASVKDPGSSEPSPLEDSTAPGESRTDVDAPPGGDVPKPSDLRLRTLREESAGSGSQTPSDDAVSPKTTVNQSSFHTKTPSLSLTAPTPVLGSNGFPSPEERPQRKAPPAPLNLSQQQRPSEKLQQPPSEEHDSDSDYDEVSEVEEMPIFQRGRKKTREEDDRQRELLVQKEIEERSQSKKSKSKSKSGKEQSPSDDMAAKAMASTSRSPVVLGLPSSPRLAQAPGSINALLSPASSDGSMIAQRSISSPLMSPGLPVSPRPGDRPPGAPTPRLPKQDIVSPPMSPRGANGLPLSPRAPRGPIPLPPQTPLAVASPHLARAEQYQPQPQNEADRLSVPTTGHSSSESNKGSASGSEPASPDGISRELVSDQYPNLLLPPNALPLIQVKVFSSRLRPSRHSFMVPGPTDEDPVFILAIHSRSDGKQLWRLEKTINALPALDQQLKKLCEFTGQLPDRSLFTGHAPSKIDARRAALNAYFDKMLDTPMGERAALILCEFFSVDAFGAEMEPPKSSALPVPVDAVTPSAKTTKEGYLTKRGKNFGGWKARYFVLESPEFRYFESPGGPLLGHIKLQNAQIGRQNPRNKANQQDDEMRHAFLILEPKRKDPTTKVSHILCAESDEERDAWIDALLQYVESSEEKPQHNASEVTREPGSARSNDSGKDSKGGGSQRERKERERDRKDEKSPERMRHGEPLQATSYESTIAADAPIMLGSGGVPSPPLGGSFPQERIISGPTNGTVIQNAELWGNRSLTTQTPLRDKKRSIFGFGGGRGRSSTDLAPGQAQSQVYHPGYALGYGQAQPPREPTPQGRVVWGIPLAEAVEATQPDGVDVLLPAVVYRCLEYLKAKNAHREEGIFRLSGSNIVIKALRERFNTERDIRLLDGEYYDVHAVASLLKSYLRDLPVSILTREFHLDFLKVLEMDQRSEKIDAFNVLVHKLPPVNLDLLRALSSFLIDITNNSDVNKMTIRNVGIVFSPTLNIPGPLISFFITDYHDIFGSVREESTSPIREVTVTAPLTPESIRSPRHQMFSDLPTPAYPQGSFQSQHKQQPSNSSTHSAGKREAQSHYDTGFIPLQPSYDTQAYGYGDGYGSLNSAALQPVNSREARARKRESGMLLMNMGLGQRKSSMQRLREESGMVQEESAFE
ncbi:hypothetical protein MPH_07830 [Macrophomina phaseolina MS6]|uniref:Rho GTPase activation protein n=2 Tax=Macrophomina phaseolina TaxID=35725 RepID=K2SDI8_MACPH|nr:hypothetical protein MPH_07830 [Macrophomina phaseolina MS6]